MPCFRKICFINTSSTEDVPVSAIEITFLHRIGILNTFKLLQMALRLYAPKCINSLHKCVFLLFSFLKKSKCFYKHVNILCDVSLFSSFFLTFYHRAVNVLALLSYL